MQEKVLQKGDLEIKIIYTGDDVLYATSFNKSSDDDEEEDDHAIDLWGPEVADIVIKKNGTNISVFLSTLFSEFGKNRFVGPVKDGFVYWESESGYISFGDLTEDGALLSLLHEIGHTEVNNRYKLTGDQEKDRESLIKMERHAWGYALLEAHQLKEKGINVEGNLSRLEVKEIIKKFLLSHEIMGRVGEAYHHGQVKNRPAEFWRSVTQENLERIIDSMYDDPEFQARDELVHRDIIKNSFSKK